MLPNNTTRTAQYLEFISNKISKGSLGGPDLRSSTKEDILPFHGSEQRKHRQECAEEK